MNRLLKIIFFALVIKPLVFLGLGLNIFFKSRLPKVGPAILLANHNSHLDTMVLMSLYPLKQIHKIRPVAAADYFLSNKYLAWFSLNIIGIIPLQRQHIRDKKSLFEQCHQALDNGDILILFPEGSRGKPEQLSELKRGVHHLIKQRSELKVVPLMLHGLGRALPKGEKVFVPYNCDVVVGEPIIFLEDAKGYMASISISFSELFSLCMTRQAIVSDD